MSKRGAQAAARRVVGNGVFVVSLILDVLAVVVLAATTRLSIWESALVGMTVLAVVLWVSLQEAEDEILELRDALATRTQPADDRRERRRQLRNTLNAIRRDGDELAQRCRPAFDAAGAPWEDWKREHEAWRSRAREALALVGDPERDQFDAIRVAPAYQGSANDPDREYIATSERHWLERDYLRTVVNNLPAEP